MFMKTLTNLEFEKIKTKALIVDVREKYEFEHLAKFDYAHNIPVQQIKKNYAQLLPDKKQLIVVVCNGGNRSSYVTQYLNDRGYEETFLLTEGIYGYYQWKQN